MSRSSKIYAYFISFIGLSLGLYCSYAYIQTIITRADPGRELIQFGTLLILYIVCRCFPIYIRDDYAIDMSFICNFATVLCKGPVAAVALILISTPFVVEPSHSEEHKFITIFNTEPIKTTFNVSNFIISIYISGQFYLWSGGQIANFIFPKILLPVILLVVSTIFLNSCILLLLFSLDSKISFFPAVLKNLIDFLPNMIAAAPIGYFIATFMLMNGEYLVLLFMLPLMLARYSFVLYLNVKQNYYNMIKTLTAALEAKDRYTEGHSHRVELYAEQIARKLRLPSVTVENIKVAALLHDVGKIGIDDEILNKPGRLTPEERAVIRTHPQISMNILKNVRLNKMVRTAILHHHERYDGGGYPDGTKGNEIPLEVYIISLADAYDAMTSNRPYSGSLPEEKVKQILREESGKQFHPKAVEAFLEVLKEKNTPEKDGGSI